MIGYDEKRILLSFKDKVVSSKASNSSFTFKPVINNKSKIIADRYIRTTFSTDNNFLYN
jgi:hypothetical protein